MYLDGAELRKHQRSLTDHSARTTMLPQEFEELGRCFQTMFRSKPRFFQAPGRVNLIGEHTDYSGGYVMPVAINFHARVAATRASARHITFHSRRFQETAVLDLDAPPQRPSGRWTDYAFGVAITLAKQGCPLAGANLLIDGDIPLGAGLSSSAAFEVVIAISLLGAANQTMTPKDVALFCQAAENDFVGARVGIMDQLTSCIGKKDRALLIDCRTLETDDLPLPTSVSMMVCNTMMKHELASGEYNRRRAQSEEAIEALSEHFPVTSLRDVSYEQLLEAQPFLDPVLFRRARHVITENARVLAAVQALKSGDLKAFGQLMNASHRSLRDDYEVSSPELDIAAEIAGRTEGVWGSRMMGGGFGGSTISLVDKARVMEVSAFIGQEYSQRSGTDCEIYVCSSADGASEVST
jgi:galactokinase